MSEPEPEHIINMEDELKEAVFSKPLSFVFNIEVIQKTIQQKVDNTISHIEKIKDDRAIVLVGSLLVENALDDFLKAIISSYKNLRDNSYFTLSLKIQLARSLKLCTGKIFTGIDTIRKIRNKFSHELSVTRFDNINKSLMQSLCDRIRDFTPSEEISIDEHVKNFRNLVALIIIGLHVYTIHISKLREFLYSGEFGANFKKFCEK
ncbi:MAG: hypothetical protein JW837_09935 [Sedimentisphaerales bacterium]|nr:hypothetical protein [Sedimentisphaerales bacterium]